MSYGRHRRPRWHDRPRAWLRGWLQWLSGRDEWDGTDDHGNHIAGDLPGVEPRHNPGVEPWHNPGINGSWLRPWERVGLLHDRPEDALVMQTAKVGGIHLPLSDDQRYNPAWCAAAFRHDVSRPVSSPSGPGHSNLPRPGRAEGPRKDPGPGQLTVWDYRPATRPGFWAPRPDDTVIETAPRIRPEIRRALAGAW